MESEADEADCAEYRERDDEIRGAFEGAATSVLGGEDDGVVEESANGAKGSGGDATGGASAGVEGAEAVGSMVRLFATIYFLMFLG